MNDYFEKLTAPKTDLTWNIPEQKQGTLNVLGGNSQNFKTSIKISEFLTANYPIKTINTILPDALKAKLPPLDNFLFLPSTDSGSFADAESIKTALDSADFNLCLGDFSKNSITKQSLATALTKTEKPTLITRDTIDLLADPAQKPDHLLLNDYLIFFASLPSLQFLLRSVYYPKMLLLSQSLLQIAEVLHKFTLSYPVKIITLNQNQILLAENGNLKSIPLEQSGYAPFTIWSGELAAKIATLNLYNPNNFLDASISAIVS